MEISSIRCFLGNQLPWFSWNPRTLDWENLHNFSCNVAACNSRTSCKSSGHSYLVSARKHGQMLWRAYSIPASLDESSSLKSEDHSSDDESASGNSPEDLLAQPLSSENLKLLLADSQREKLIKKLSEANQQNRFFKRQLHMKEDALVKFKSELAVMELEIQALVALAQEIVNTGSPQGSRKINGRYIQSHLLSRLKVMHEKLMEHIKDVNAAQSKNVSIFWCGMAESVQVMGSFDGWSQGEHLSPEYDGSSTKFSTTLTLRPGRYEIKFLVDGEWQLSPEYPTVGEGLMENNLLIVE